MTKPRRRAPQPPPVWLSSVVVLVLLGLLAYNIIVVGPEGIPNSYVLGGLLGAYVTGDRLLRNSDDDEGQR